MSRHITSRTDNGLDRFISTVKKLQMTLSVIDRRKALTRVLQIYIKPLPQKLVISALSFPNTTLHSLPHHLRKLLFLNSLQWPEVSEMRRWRRNYDKTGTGSIVCTDHFYLKPSQKSLFSNILWRYGSFAFILSWLFIRASLSRLVKINLNANHGQQSCCTLSFVYVTWTESVKLKHISPKQTAINFWTTLKFQSLLRNQKLYTTVETC